MKRKYILWKITEDGLEHLETADHDGTVEEYVEGCLKNFGVDSVYLAYSNGEVLLFDSDKFLKFPASPIASAHLKHYANDPRTRFFQDEAKELAELMRNL